MHQRATPSGPGFATMALHAGDRRTASGDAAALLEERIATLEGGSAAVLTAPGWAAALLVLHALLEPGAQVLVGSAVGEPLARVAADFGWELVAVDAADPLGLEAYVTAGTGAILVDSMGPAGGIVDIAALAKIAERAAVPLIVDNTRASPFLVRPIEHGAHAVLHSGSAMLGGPGTSALGMVVDAGTFDWFAGSKLAVPEGADRSFADRFGNFALAAAVRASPWRDMAAAVTSAAAFSVLSGLATLPLRAQRQSATALTVATRLVGHEALRGVDYAGLPDPAMLPLAHLYRPQGAGPLVTLHLHAGISGSAVAERLQLFERSGVEGVRSAILDRSGEDDAGLLLWLGLEDPDDLLADLDQAFAAL